MEKLRDNLWIWGQDAGCHHSGAGLQWKIPGSNQMGPVEGAEYLVIQGALEIIQQHKPVLMLEMLRKWMRCFHVHPNDVINELKNMGYKCYSVSPQTALLIHVPFVDENTSETNFFFLHTEAHSTILDCLTEEKEI